MDNYVSEYLDHFAHEVDQIYILIIECMSIAQKG